MNLKWRPLLPLGHPPKDALPRPANQASRSADSVSQIRLFLPDDDLGCATCRTLLVASVSHALTSTVTATLSYYAMASNVEILTRSHTIIKAKARAKKNQIDQIVFDEDARRSVAPFFHPKGPSVSTHYARHIVNSLLAFEREI